REVEERVSDLTRRAMVGDIPLDSVYGERLALVVPSWDNILGLSKAYARALAPGAQDALYRIREQGSRVVLVSGGVREAILPVATELGFTGDDLHAVSL